MEERRLMAAIDLASLMSSEGITIIGEEAGARSGSSVKSAGDMNGDGFDDIVIGAPRAGQAEKNGGKSYVIFGSEALPATIDLGNLGSAGMTIVAARAYGNLGVSVSGAGDVNGDGFDDLIIGADRVDGPVGFKYNAGESYVVFGRPSLPRVIDLAALGSEGITILGGDFFNNSGHSVSKAGDINADGFDDLLIGAPGSGLGGNARAGESYVIFGGSKLPSTIELANLGLAGIKIIGEDSFDESGFSVSGAGDVNGDGLDDLIVGAPTADGGSETSFNIGESYIILGRQSLPTTIELGKFNSSWMVIYGGSVFDYSGVSVSGAGDVNGDGFDDVIVGADRADGFGDAKLNGGESYLIFGGASTDKTDRATIFGSDGDDRSGISVSGAGDINGDGFDDLIIGAFQAAGASHTRPFAGESYVIFGGKNFPKVIDLANLGSAGITLFGADAGDRSGISVSGAGDVNGDGFDDLVVGAFAARGASNAMPYAGETYVLYGRDFTGSVTHQGTATPETLKGREIADVIIGGGSDDLLLGQGGADVLIGGQGDDVLVVSDTEFQRIVGGTGIDTLRLDGNGLTLDLRAIANNRILDIEAIDITGAGNNQLALNAHEVMALSSTTNTLKLKYNTGDSVVFEAGWLINTPSVVDGDFTHLLTKEAAVINITNDLPYQNPFVRFDTDLDGMVSPIDTLVLINALRREGTRELYEPSLSPSSNTFRYLDVTGDQWLSPLDVLQVINFLSRRSSSGEVESSKNSSQSVAADSSALYPFNMYACFSSSMLINRKKVDGDLTC